MKVAEARHHGLIEFADNEHIRCLCGKVLKKSRAGYGAGFSIPNHKPKKN